MLGLALAVAVGYGAFRLFDYVRTTLATMPQLVSAIEINILNGVSLFMLMIVFTTGIQTTYKTIYESDDLGFLMAQPVPVQAIFLSKFMSSYVSLAAVALVLGLPAWLGYAVATRADGHHRVRGHCDVQIRECDLAKVPRRGDRGEDACPGMAVQWSSGHRSYAG